MKTLLVKGASNVAPFAAATAVAFFSAVIGFGFYHGAFHMNGNSTHCHAEGVCHNH
jgi:high-affinity Fe2+/Pb2+ permease